MSWLPARTAHAFLPLGKKAGSDWRYAPVPVIGPLLGAALGGMAIENSMLGGAHAAANPVTAHFGLAHGQAVGLMLPHVIRFNAHRPESRKIYIELGVVADLTSSGHDPASQMLVERIETLTGLSLDDPETRVAISIALRARAMLGM